MMIGLLLILAPVSDAAILRQPSETNKSSQKPSAPNYFDKFDDLIPKLGPGPHTLVISDGSAMTKMDYKTGPLCGKARDSVRRQVAPPPNTKGVIYSPSSTKAFCVPR